MIIYKIEERPEVQRDMDLVRGLDIVVRWSTGALADAAVQMVN